MCKRTEVLKVNLFDMNLMYDKFCHTSFDYLLQKQTLINHGCPYILLCESFLSEYICSNCKWQQNVDIQVKNYELLLLVWTAINSSERSFLECFCIIIWIIDPCIQYHNRLDHFERFQDGAVSTQLLSAVWILIWKY